jgi:hypothetical protein
MALNDNDFSSKLQALYTKMAASPMSNKDYADEIAKILDAQTKTAQVKQGIPVQTTRTSSSQTGATTGAGAIE